MPKTVLFVLSLIVVLTTAAVVFFSKNNFPPESVYKPGRDTEIDTAVNQAQYIYRIRKEKGQDFSTGPCLTDALLPGWVVDIVHVPRQLIDDLPENQCAALLEGSATHIIELDLEGNLVRAK